MRCPKCGDNTRQPTPRHHERCVIDTCDVATIRRNNRGQAWAYDAAGRLVYKPNRHPEPTDQGPTCLAPLPPPPDYDGFQITNHGTFGFSRKRETQP